MREDSGNNESGLSMLIEHLAVEKKKCVMALCLIGVMVFMWVKMLSGNSPRKAGASMTAQKATEEVTKVKDRILFVELPDIRGRNDVITRDFFTVAGDDLEGVEEAAVSSNGDYGERGEYLKKAIESKLSLDAIVSGENPQVFINDKLLSVGDTLFIDMGEDFYECKIKDVGDNAAIIQCGEFEITIKIANK